MWRRHWHGAVNVIPQRRRERPIAAHGQFRPVVLQRSNATGQLGEAALALAKRAVAGRALLGEHGLALADVTAAGRQANAVVATRIYVPPGDLLWCRYRSITEMTGLGRNGCHHRRQQRSHAPRNASSSPAEHRRCSRRVSPAKSGSNCCGRPNSTHAAAATRQWSAAHSRFHR